MIKAIINTIIAHNLTFLLIGTSTTSNFLFSFALQSILFHFLFIIALGIGNIAFCPEHLIFCQFLHGLRQILIQFATLDIAVYGIQPLFVYLDNRMIVCKLPLFSAFQIADLSAGAV